MSDHTDLLIKIEHEVSQLRPMLQNDGGDIEIVKFEDSILYISFLGACAHCPISQFTLKLGIEDTLRSKIPEIKKVVNIGD